MREKFGPAGFRRAVTLSALSVLVMMLASILTVNVSAMLFGSLFSKSTTAQLVINDVGLYVLGLPIALFLWSLVPGKAMPIKVEKPLSVPFFAAFAVFSLGLGYVASMITQAFSFTTGLPDSSQIQEMMTEIPPLTSLLLIAVAPAVLEELVFRGILYQKLAPYGEKPYVLLSAFFFATFHGNLSQLLFAFFLGGCFALITYRTGSMVYGMLLHFTINFLSSCVLAPFVNEPVVNLLMGLWIMACIAMTIAFAVLWHRGLRLRPGQNLPQHPVVAAMLNPGMLTWIIVSILLIVLSFF